jgi:hypothetical protein
MQIDNYRGINSVAKSHAAENVAGRFARQLARLSCLSVAARLFWLKR